MFGLFKSKPSPLQMMQRLMHPLFECAYVHAMVKSEYGKDCIDSLYLWVMRDYDIKAIYNQEPIHGFQCWNICEIANGKIQPPFKKIPVFERYIALAGMDDLSDMTFRAASSKIQKGLKIGTVDNTALKELEILASNVFMGAELYKLCGK